MWWMLAAVLAAEPGYVAGTAFEDGSPGPLRLEATCDGTRVRTVLRWQGAGRPAPGRTHNLAVYVGHVRSEFDLRFARDGRAAVSPELEALLVQRDVVTLQPVGLARVATLAFGEHEAGLDAVHRACGHIRGEGLRVRTDWVNPDGELPWLMHQDLTFSYRQRVEYPRRARGTQDGVVVCRVSVRFEPKRAKDVVAHDCPEVFAKAAVGAVKRWRIEPVLDEDGEPASVRTDVFLRFKEPAR